MGRDQILSPADVEGLIADGATILILHDHVLKLDSWLDRHPGGRLAILHMVGKDATDEIIAFHSPATVNTMKAFRIGRKPAGPWPNMTPPIRGGVFSKLQTGSQLPRDSSCMRAESVGGSSPASEVDVIDHHDNVVGGDRDADAAGHEDAYTYTDADERVPTCPKAYTNYAVQQGVDVCKKEYPCPDSVDLQQDIVHRYRQLHQQVLDEGLYKCPYGAYGREATRYATLFATFLVTLRYEWYMTSAVFLGLFWHQIMFTAHDAGHRAITQNFTVDSLIGLFIADFCCGLSIGWWKKSHNVHHLVTNHPTHDPDIQNVPLFATCPSFFKSLHSTYYDFSFVWDAAASFLVQYQSLTYYPVMAIARFNLYVLSWLHVFSSHSTSLGGTKAWWIRPTEIFFMSCYWFLFGYCLVWRTLPTWWIRVGFVLVSHVMLMPLHVQINLSHWGMSTSDLGDTESFAQRQMRTTMDVDCPAWLDWIHGGLQFQVAHHLFPRVPRHNLRRVQTLGMEFSKDTGIPYSILGFLDGNKKVLGRLGDISEQAKILIRCQNSMVETGTMGMH